LAASDGGPSAALQTYVDKPDDSYGWVKRREGQLGGTKYAELTLTSQTWRGIVWKHQLFVIQPSKIDDASQAILLIAGSRWRPELDLPPAEGDKLPGEAQVLALVAEQIRSPVAILLHVPFQPILGNLVEDAAISYTFDEYLKSGDEEWPLLLPMVKSATRAMDAVQEFTRDEWQLDVKNFTVSGASKRGWTTWLTGAVEPRATAIAPMVIDVLNMGPQMKHQLDSFGDFSEQIRDYTERGLQKQMSSAAGESLNAIVDPYRYRAALTQPKLIMLGTNDRYWPLDAANLYWDGLVGEKHLLYVPNNGHGLKDLARVTGTLIAFHKQAAGQFVLPKLKWDLKEADDALELTVTSDVPPRGVSAWRTTAATRDFRDAQWVASDADQVPGEGSEKDSGQYRYVLPRPTAGFAALFGEVVFEHDGLPYYLSTNVRIVGAKQAAGE
jgi:PhoPQ-activated pathogenicity-related protein